MAAGGAWALADPFASVDPLPPGAYPVGCSNVAQDFGSTPTDGDRSIFWEGTSVGSRGHYVTQLLAEPLGAFTYNVNVPDVIDLFATFAGQSVPYAAIVCYPTSASNPRADYAYDAALTKFVPRMQRGGDPPLWADANTRYPILLYSHGLNGSPLSRDYLQTIASFASYGYVVVAPFHGDGRFADVSIDGLSDLVRLFFNRGFREVVAMQAVRPLSLKSALDRLLADPNYRDHVDADRVAGFGTSLGAETLLLYSGARLTTNFIPLQSAPVMSDARLKAIAGYVPYFGQRLLPAFGDDQNGVDGMTVPFLGIVGTADDTAPLLLTEQGVNRMKGARYVVAIDGLTHTRPMADVPDISTWALTFIDAYVNNSEAARGRIARMNSVNGGAVDSVHIAYTPLPPPPSTQAVFTFPTGHLPSDLVQVTSGGSFSGADLKLTLDIAKLLQALAATGFSASSCNVYVLALVPGARLGLDNSAWYVKRAPAGDWAPLQLPIAAYIENAAPTPVSGPVVIDILAGADISSLAGTEIYVGYGISDLEMLTANRYRGIYKVQ